MKLGCFVDFYNSDKESAKLKKRMNKFLEYYAILPDDVSLVIKQGAVENIVDIYPENRYFTIEGLCPKRKERGELGNLTIGKSAVIKIGRIEYQIKFKNENLPQ